MNKLIDAIYKLSSITVLTDCIENSKDFAADNFRLEFVTTQQEEYNELHKIYAVRFDGENYGYVRFIAYQSSYSEESVNVRDVEQVFPQNTIVFRETP